jgi:hypothetical protein
MQTASYSEATIPLPPSPLDPNVPRVMLYELTDDASNEGWRMFQLTDGTYAFETRQNEDVLFCEHHSSFADASARIDRWYGDHPGNAA